MTRFLTRALTLCALLGTAPLMTGCEILEDPMDLLTVNVPISITLPAELPITYPSHDAITTLPIRSNGERVFEIPPVYIPGPDIAAQIPQLSGDNVIKAVTITGVTVTVSENTMPVPIEPFELRIGSPDGTFDQAYPMAMTAEVAPGANGEFAGEIIAQNSAPISQILRTASFGMGIATQIVIPAGAPPGSGSAKARFSFTLEVTVGP